MKMNSMQRAHAGRLATAMIDKGRNAKDKVYPVYFPESHYDAACDLQGLSDTPQFEGQVGYSLHLLAYYYEPVRVAA